MPPQKHIGTALFISFLILLLSSFQPASAVNVSEGTYFQTTGAKTQYYMAANFTLNNVTVYPTALDFNGGSISVWHSYVEWISISLQNVAGKTNYSDGVIYFYNDPPEFGDTPKLTVTNNFANFTITDGIAYMLCQQVTGAVHQISVASSGEINFTDIPDGAWYITTAFGTGIHGFVYSYSKFEPINGATVNIWDGTGWSNSTTTNEFGYYVFTNLSTPITNETFNSSVYDAWVTLNHTYIVNDSQVVTNITDEIPFYNNTDYVMNYTTGKIKTLSGGNMTDHTLYHIDYSYVNQTTVYSLNATASLHNGSEDVNVIVTKDEYIQHDFLLAHYFTIHARDAETHATIDAFSATWKNTTLNTSNGTIVFTTNLTAGDSIEVAAIYYYPGVVYAYYDSVTGNFSTYEVTINLTQVGEGAGVYYPPHLVRFFVQDIYANPQKNVEVTVTCVETTMDSWDWIYKIFGYKSELQLENTTLNGTTDSAGSISFLMIETVKYNLHFKNTSQDIDENLTIYPKSDRYTVIVGRTGFFDVEPQLFGEEIVWNFTMEKIDSDDAWLNFSYNDILNQTTSGGYYVYTVNETTGIEKINMSNLTYYCNTTLYNMSSVWNYSCTVHDYRGKTYILGFNATHTTAGDFEESVSVFFRYNHPLIEFSGWTEGYYQFLSIALLIFLGMLFTGVTIKLGCVVLPLAAWFLYGIGWFSPTSDLVTSTVLLGIATAIGIGVYVTTTGREKNLAS